MITVQKTEFSQMSVAELLMCRAIEVRAQKTVIGHWLPGSAYAGEGTDAHDQLVEAIAILDKSKGNPEDNSRMLWNREHARVREILLWLLKQDAAARVRAEDGM